MNTSSDGGPLPARTSPATAAPAPSQCLDSAPQSHSAERRLIVVKREGTKGAKLAFSTRSKRYPRQSVHACLPENGELRARRARSLRQRYLSTIYSSTTTPVISHERLFLLCAPLPGCLAAETRLEWLSLVSAQLACSSGADKPTWWEGNGHLMRVLKPPGMRRG